MRHSQSHPPSSGTLRFAALPVPQSTPEVRLHAEHARAVFDQIVSLPPLPPSGLEVMPRPKDCFSRSQVIFKDENGFCYKITDGHVLKEDSKSAVPVSTIEERTARWAEGMVEAQIIVQRNLAGLGDRTCDVFIPSVTPRKFLVRDLYQQGIIGQDVLGRILGEHKDVSVDSEMVLPGIQFIDDLHELPPHKVKEALATGKPLDVEGAEVAADQLRHIVENSWVDDIRLKHKNIAYVMKGGGRPQLMIIDIDPDQVSDFFGEPEPKSPQALDDSSVAFTAAVPTAGTQAHIDRVGSATLDAAIAVTAKNQERACSR